MTEPSDYQGVVTSLSPTSMVQSTDMTLTSIGAPPSGDNLFHPVSNKPIPSTAVIRKDIVRVSTPGNIPEVTSDSAQQSIPDSDVISPKSPISKGKIGKYIFKSIIHNFRYEAKSLQNQIKEKN